MIRIMEYKAIFGDFFVLLWQFLEIKNIIWNNTKKNS